LWKTVFLNSSYLSQLNKRSFGKYIPTLLLRNHFKVYNQIVYELYFSVYMKSLKIAIDFYRFYAL
jgi:hypothetical protein